MASEQQQQQQQQQLHIGIIVFDGFEELDAVGPLEVFGVSDKLHASRTIGLNDDGGNDSTINTKNTTTNASTNTTNTNTNTNTNNTTKITPRYKVVTVAVPGNPGGRHVRGSNGMVVVADYAADDPDPAIPPMPALNVVLVPGGEGARHLTKDRDVTGWLASLCERATWTTSVCTGVFLLHAAGCVTGKRVATHFKFEKQLEALGGEGMVVVRDQRWVVDGSLVTSQGISAGIDMSLWLIGQLHSPEHARETQKRMQYEPAPPYNADGEAPGSSSQLTVEEATPYVHGGSGGDLSGPMDDDDDV